MHDPSLNPRPAGRCGPFGPVLQELSPKECKGNRCPLICNSRPTLTWEENRKHAKTRTPLASSTWRPGWEGRAAEGQAEHRVPAEREEAGTQQPHDPREAPAGLRRPEPTDPGSAGCRQGPGGSGPEGVRASRPGPSPRSPAPASRAPPPEPRPGSPSRPVPPPCPGPGARASSTATASARSRISPPPPGARRGSSAAACPPPPPSPPPAPPPQPFAPRPPRRSAPAPPAACPTPGQGFWS